jgi:hypothetical protein
MLFLNFPFPATLCFPRAISCHVTLPSRSFLLHCASLAQFPATLCFPCAISCHIALPALPSSPILRRYSHPSLPHDLPQASHDMWMTYRQLPHALAATIASVMFPLSFLRRLQVCCPLPNTRGRLSLHLSRHH